MKNKEMTTWYAKLLSCQRKNRLNATYRLLGRIKEHDRARPFDIYPDAEDRALATRCQYRENLS